MLRRGVARHSLPPRDVIIRPDGRVGLVDFERVTLRRWRYSPIWGIACAITRFHVLRMIGARAPHLLEPAERRRLRLQRVIRDALHVINEWRRRIRGRSAWKKDDAVEPRSSRPARD